MSGSVAFQFADECTVEYEVGEARLRLDGRERTTLVVFGPPDAAPLPGATILELFNLVVDPLGKRLVSVPGLLKLRRRGDKDVDTVRVLGSA